ncbi:MAG: hypothetical protein GC190_14715 [Alphaproteobacteria bacterium]|nr:hypothetical protein [Alphaproteobacteria bacterium]
MSEQHMPDVTELNALGNQIRIRIRELRERGAFTDAKSSYLIDIEDRQARTAEKLAAAIKHHKTGQMLAAELSRDYYAIWEDLARFAERIDAESMRAQFGDLKAN